MPQFIYGSVKVDAGEGSTLNSSSAFLVGLTSRLLLIPEDDARWSATGTLAGHSLSRVDGRLIDDCQLSGGQWAVTSESNPQLFTLMISGAVMNRYESWFAPLLNMVRSSTS